MSLLHSFLFSLWFASTDLFGRRTLRITLVNLFGVLALVAFALLIYGLVLGTDHRRMKQFEEDPAATCLIVRPTARGVNISAGDIDRLAKDIRGKLHTGDHLRAVAGITLLEQDWFYPGDDRSPRCQGRTVTADDLLFDSYKDKKHWLAGGPPQPGQSGVVISAAMMKRLDLDVGKLPTHLDVRTAIGKESLPLLGVLTGEFPGRRDYVLPEPLWNELRRKAAAPRVDEIFSGPLPAQWAALEEPPATVEEYLRQQGVEWVNRLPRGDGKVWRLRHGGAQPPRLDLWQIYLENVARRVEKAAGPVDRKLIELFTRPDPVGVVSDPTPVVQEGYDWIALYPRLLDDLIPAIAAARQEGYEPTDDRHDQIERIRKTTTKALALFGVVLFAVAVLVGWNIYIIQSLQAKQKLAEVGMLKAMGLTRLALAGIYLVEAVLLWLPGTLGGIAVGWGLGILAEWWLSRDDPQAMLAFSLEPIWLTIIVGVSFALCLGSTLLATRKAIFNSPVECLTES